MFGMSSWLPSIKVYDLLADVKFQYVVSFLMLPTRQQGSKKYFTLSKQWVYSIAVVLINPKYSIVWFMINRWMRKLSRMQCVSTKRILDASFFYLFFSANELQYTFSNLTSAGPNLLYFFQT